MCFGKGYCLLGCLCILSLVCSCASVWDNVYWGVCVL